MGLSPWIVLRCVWTGSVFVVMCVFLRTVPAESRSGALRMRLDYCGTVVMIWLWRTSAHEQTHAHTFTHTYTHPIGFKCWVCCKFFSNHSVKLSGTIFFFQTWVSALFVLLSRCTLANIAMHIHSCVCMCERETVRLLDGRGERGGGTGFRSGLLLAIHVFL